tara:strand:+ start:484 stop:699 length:216 start_codon:yes stop_codon:yes gene_type:complete
MDKGGGIMGMIKDKAMDFLNDGGFDLSYDEWTLPKLDDMDVILENNVHVWDYRGVTEEEWYGIDQNEGRTD